MTAGEDADLALSAGMDAELALSAGEDADLALSAGEDADLALSAGMDAEFSGVSLIIASSAIASCRSRSSSRSTSPRSSIIGFSSISISLSLI